MSGMCIASPSASVMESSANRDEENEVVLWRRIVDTRVQECLVMGDAVFQSIFQAFGKTVSDRSLFAETLKHLLHHHIQIFTGRDSTINDVTVRRESWRLVQGAFDTIDNAKRGATDGSVRQPTAESNHTGRASESSDGSARQVEVSSATRDETAAVDPSPRASPNETSNPQPPNSTSEGSRADSAFIPRVDTMMARAGDALPVTGRIRSNSSSASRRSRSPPVGSAFRTQTTSGSSVEAAPEISRPTSTNSSESDAGTIEHTPCHQDNGAQSSNMGNGLPSLPNKEVAPTRQAIVESGRDSNNLPPKMLLNSASPTNGSATTLLDAEKDQRIKSAADLYSDIDGQNRKSRGQLPEAAVENGSFGTPRTKLSSSYTTFNDSMLPPADNSQTNLMISPLVRRGNKRRAETEKSDQASDMSMSDGSEEPAMGRCSQVRNVGPPSLSSIVRERTSSPSVPLESKFVKCKKDDVLIVWGTRARSWPGNVQFFRYYTANLTRREGCIDDLLLDAMKDVESRGGRFLREYNSSSSRALTDDEWLQMESEEAIERLRSIINVNPEFQSSPFEVRTEGVHSDRNESLDDRSQFVEENIGTYRCRACRTIGILSTHLEKHRRKCRGHQAIPLDLKSHFAVHNESAQTWRCVECAKTGILSHHLENHFRKCLGRRRFSNPQSDRVPTAVDTLSSESPYGSRSRDYLNRVSEDSDSGRASYREKRQLTPSSGGTPSECHQTPSWRTKLLADSAPFLHKLSSKSWSCHLCQVSLHPDDWMEHLLQLEHNRALDEHSRREAEKREKFVGRFVSGRDGQGETVSTGTPTSRQSSDDGSVVDLLKTPRGKASIERTPDSSNGITKLATFPVQPDKGSPTLAGTLATRGETRVTVGGPFRADLSTAMRRLNEWDPFWYNAQILMVGMTTKVHSVDPATDLIKTAAQYYLPYPLREKVKDPRLQWNQKRSSTKWCAGDVALILRMLPLNSRAYKMKRADCHLWPKGTYIQVNGKPIAIQQRRQQEHNSGQEWKGMSKELDVTPLLDLGERNRIQICCFDDQPYIYMLVCCKYRSDSVLFRDAAGLSTFTKDIIPVLSKEDSIQKAVGLASRQATVALDCEIDDKGDMDNGKFIFSLSCPYTKTLLSTPVRGKSCKHFQVSQRDFLLVL
jgi:hypothetical protein